MTPTAILYRNLLAIEVKELLRSHPIDGAVLMGGCDTTAPATIMGAISMDLPTVFMPAGPIMRAHHAGQILGSGSDAWKYWGEKEAGTITNQQWSDIEAGIARSNGTWMTMGTASTMTSIAEALGTHAPSVVLDPGRRRRASAHGHGLRSADRRDDLGRSQALRHPRGFVENALIVHNALAGSTNAMIHLVALAGHAGVALKLTDFDDFARRCR